MFDHVGLKVSDLKASTSFYSAALKPLGLTLESSGEGYAGYGPGGQPQLWLHGHAGARGPGAHVALRAASLQAVQAFHAAALAHGGRDNGPPGLRPDYGTSYYAAFVLDPDGHNIEAVCLD